MNMLDALFRQYPSLLRNQSGADVRNTTQPMQSQPMPMDAPQEPSTFGASLMSDVLGVNQNTSGMMDSQAYGIPQQAPVGYNQMGQSLQPQFGGVNQPQQIGYNQAPMMQPQMMQQPMIEEEQRRMQYTGY
jgi:hypothetical protein